MRRARISCMDKREDATQKGNSTQLGMPTLIENATLEDNVALCSSLGLNFVELNMNFPEYRIDRLEQTDEMIQLAKQAGIYYTVHLDENLNIADFNPLVSGAYLETVRRSVFAAKKLLPLRDRFGDKSQPFISLCRIGKFSYMSGILISTWILFRCFALYARNGSMTVT